MTKKINKSYHRVPEHSDNSSHGVLQHTFNRQVLLSQGDVQELADTLERLAVGRHGDCQFVDLGPLGAGQIVKSAVAPQLFLGWTRKQTKMKWKGA